MPQPFLNPPSEPSPHKDRAPLSGPLTPVQLSTHVRDVPPLSYCLGFHRRLRFRAVAWIPQRL